MVLTPQSMPRIICVPCAPAFTLTLCRLPQLLLSHLFVLLLLQKLLDLCWRTIEGSTAQEVGI